MSEVRDFLETLKFSTLPVLAVTSFLMCPHWSYLFHFFTSAARLHPGLVIRKLFCQQCLWTQLLRSGTLWRHFCHLFSSGVSGPDSRLRGLSSPLRANTCGLQCFAGCSLVTVSGVVITALKKCCHLGRDGTSWSGRALQIHGGHGRELQEEDTDLVFSTLWPLFGFQLVHRMCLMQVRRPADTHRRQYSDFVCFQPVLVTFLMVVTK